ncbi:MAG: hypothetical protein ACI83P_001975 [Janthinobacterium sp.]|jgi:hypothetical protein
MPRCLVFGMRLAIGDGRLWAMALSTPFIFYRNNAALYCMALDKNNA